MQNEIRPLIGNKNYSNNGTECIHELEECIPSIAIDKGHTNQVMKAKHNTIFTRLE